MAGLEMEQGDPMPRKYRQPLEAEKSQEIDLLKPPEWNASLLVYMWDDSHRISTECWQKTLDC